MSRAPARQVEQAAQAVLSDGERVTATGSCWAVQLRPRVPLLFLARHKYLMALTTRRALVFARRRRGPGSSDLVIAKRYDTFVIDRVRRHRPLLQIIVTGSNGNRLVFEFPRGQRALAGELIARLTPPPGANDRTPAAAPVATAPRKARPGDAHEDEAFWGAPK